MMAEAFDSITANRREALWDAGLPIRPSRNGQRAFPSSGTDRVPQLADFTEHERADASRGKMARGAGGR